MSFFTFALSTLQKKTLYLQVMCASLPVWWQYDLALIGWKRGVEVHISCAEEIQRSAGMEAI